MFILFVMLYAILSGVIATVNPYIGDVVIVSVMSFTWYLHPMNFPAISVMFVFLSELFVVPVLVLVVFTQFPVAFISSVKLVIVSLSVPVMFVVTFWFCLKFWLVFFGFVNIVGVSITVSVSFPIVLFP